MDTQRFAAALTAAQNCSSREGIGRLAERTLHAALKFYYEPEEQFHEIRTGPFIADIRNGSGIIEIQTRHMASLKDKLACFLPLGPVTVVYPIPERKWIIWIDTDTGERTPPRRSPRAGSPLDVFYELRYLRPFLSHPNFRLRILMMDLEDHRLLNGWSRDKKRGSTRCERLPTALHREICIDRPGDYLGLLPDTLPSDFTSADLAREAGIRSDLARTVLRLLYDLGLADRTGKQGNAILYRLHTPDSLR